MRVVDVARLLNSTDYGFVLSQGQLYPDFNRAGFRIADGDNPRNINLLKYIAHLCDELHTPAQPLGARSYDERRDAERARQAEQSVSGRDIGALPDVADAERKGASEKNFRLFCESSFPKVFHLSWSPDH
jgi:hypothetical protein